jgi:molybdopterin adenylyltransferase
MSHSSADAPFVSINIAVLTVSDSRTEETDTSGQTLVIALTEVGHSCADKKIVTDDIYRIRATVSQWIVDPNIEAILITGGTGFSGRDSTPEAVQPLFDKTIDGFGELFRMLSYDDIGTSTIQSRALAGLANNTVIFCMPGSTNACRTAWQRIIAEQLDNRHAPCNYVKFITAHRHAAPCETRN